MVPIVLERILSAKLFSMDDSKFVLEERELELLEEMRTMT